MDTPRCFMNNWEFRVIVDAESGDATFTKPEVWKGDSYVEATDEDLDAVVFPHHVLMLCRHGETRGRIKSEGETFTAREVIGLLIELEIPHRKKARYADYVVFRHLTRLFDTTYSSAWNKPWMA